MALLPLPTPDSQSGREGVPGHVGKVQVEGRRKWIFPRWGPISEPEGATDPHPYPQMLWQVMEKVT